MDAKSLGRGEGTELRRGEKEKGSEGDNKIPFTPLLLFSSSS
jgi:hypothetical protein